MRGVTVVLLALLTRALNPCCTLLSLGDAERENGHRGVKVSRAFIFVTNITCPEFMTCKGHIVEERTTCKVTHHVKNLEVITVQVIIVRCSGLCLFELNRQDLHVKYSLEPNQTTQGLHEVSLPSSRPCSNCCFVHLLFFKFVDGYYSHPTERNISDSCWTNALHMIYELNVKTRVMNCVCSFKVHIFMAANKQMNMTGKLRMRTGVWHIPSTFTEENVLELKKQRLTLSCESVAASKALIRTSLWPTGCLFPLSICVCTTTGCKCVLTLHRSLCIISLMGEKESQFRHIWPCSMETQRELIRKTKNHIGAKMLIFKKQKGISPLHWQINTQLKSRWLFPHWFLRMFFLTVILLLIGKTAILIYVNYKQRLTSIHRARNSNLSVLLLFTMSLQWCSLSSLPVTGQSTGCSCKLHHTAFGITFVFCISCVLGKTIVVLLAFKATIPGSHVMKWFGPLPPRLSVSVFVLSQIAVIVFWFLLHSPCLKIIMTGYQEYCDLSVIGFCPSLNDPVFSFILTFLVCNMLFTTTYYSMLNIHTVVCLSTRISLTHSVRIQHY